MRGHESCRRCELVRILEARFHPSSKTGRSVVSVGRVICDGSRATIVPVNVSPMAVRPFDAARLREKLEFLVMSFPRDVCGGLLQLRSEFWSFVELHTPEERGPRTA